ncbi:Flavin reductase (NADPH) [Armadillidium nasatum]|uniref:Flavin reductase (NADPH) n=1 Tax=Armadillidium nasatum TaxID=96803 RepID=A0A5N5TG64_9CRUS|nr:Flavin reductase (NADPH) [Armadillidium nasatum]
MLITGYDVTVFVRDESKIPQDLRSNVNVAVGDVLNYADVERAVMGHDGVVIVLGTRNDLSPTTLLSEGTKNILSAMESYGIRRVTACISSFLFWDKARVPAQYHSITEDHEKMLQHLKDSNTDWTAVLPPHITDSPSRGTPPVISHDKGPGRTISKYDLGGFLVTTLAEEEHIGKVCGICDA